MTSYISRVWTSITHENSQKIFNTCLSVGYCAGLTIGYLFGFLSRPNVVEGIYTGSVCGSIGALSGAFVGMVISAIHILPLETAVFSMLCVCLKFFSKRFSVS